MKVFAKLATLVFAGATVAVANAGIYPDDHFDYSTKLTTSNFNDEITSAVDGGKTMFVRWIASEGWGWWRKQAPNWNQVVKDYAGEDSVVFGDVLLRNDRITQGPNGGNLNPGKGGWPTVRYFNKETGYDGAPYVKKTGDAMCTELGPGKPYLSDFVGEFVGAKEL